MNAEESYLGILRRLIEEQYRAEPTGCGDSFGEILCYELHFNGLTFKWLSEKWGISLPTLGELIWDHCKRLEELPRVDHQLNVGELIMVRCYRKEPALKCLLKEDNGFGATLVCEPDDSARTIGWPKKDVFFYNEDLFRAMEEAFIADSDELRLLWAKAKPYYDEFR